VAGEFTLAGLDYSLLREQLPQLLDEVLDGAQRIKQIVEELKDFSRPFDARQFTPVDLCEVARKAVQLVSNQLKKATDRFELLCQAGSPPTPGNAQRLEQVLINLILNACQALPDRRCGITVAVRYHRELQSNLIEVRDEGCGIKPEHLAQITDPFFTTRREVGGTGLGLSVSTRIIEEHGGTLHFASEPGHGTVVTITLPVRIEEEQHG
jgi:polar amino acid transport system substrate-binding protein